MQQTKEQRIGREMMQNLNNTQYFRVEKEPEMQVKDVLAVVYQALTEGLQSGEPDCWVYYVWRSHLYYQP